MIVLEIYKRQVLVCICIWKLVVCLSEENGGASPDRKRKRRNKPKKTSGLEDSFPAYLQVLRLLSYCYACMCMLSLNGCEVKLQ